VVIYWHVDRRSTCIYSQLKSCSASEVAAMITGVLHHCTAMAVDRQYVDSHGQSEVAFGICRLLGFDLLPRLKPIQTQKLYLPSAAHAARYPRCAPILSRPIDWELIRSQYDDLVKYATALRSGIADAEAILRRFTRHTTHATYRAMAELGRVMKTIFLCRYLHDFKLRREIQEGLNVVENWNSATSFIGYGRHGEFATNRREHMEVGMLTLQLLQNCVVYVNTVMFQEILEEPAWMKRMTKADLRALTPLVYHHINPYGQFPLDLTTRLPLRPITSHRQHSGWSSG
jgi:TnpA family transposase